MAQPTPSAKGPLSRAYRPFARPIFEGSSGEGFRMPAPSGTVVRDVGPAFESLPRRKPRVGRALFCSGANYGDLGIADGWRASPRWRVVCGFGGGNVDGWRFRSRG